MNEYFLVLMLIFIINVFYFFQAMRHHLILFLFIPVGWKFGAQHPVPGRKSSRPPNLQHPLRPAAVRHGRLQGRLHLQIRQTFPHRNPRHTRIQFVPRVLQVLRTRTSEGLPQGERFRHDSVAREWANQWSYQRVLWERIPGLKHCEWAGGSADWIHWAVHWFVVTLTLLKYYKCCSIESY